jgi:hypothetical protein
MLRVDFCVIVQANPGTLPHFCKFNSGAARMTDGRRSPRGPDTFQTADEWTAPPSRVAEVSFLHKVLLPDCTEVWHPGAGWRPL